MFRIILLAALFAAVACASHEESSDVSAADESAADMAGEAFGSTHKSAGGAFDSDSEPATEVVQQGGQVFAEARGAAQAVAPEVELPPVSVVGDTPASVGQRLEDAQASGQQKVNTAQEQAGEIGAFRGQTQP